MSPHHEAKATEQVAAARMGALAVLHTHMPADPAALVAARVAVLDAKAALERIEANLAATAGQIEAGSQQREQLKAHAAAGHLLKGSELTKCEAAIGDAKAASALYREALDPARDRLEAAMKTQAMEVYHYTAVRKRVALAAEERARLALQSMQDTFNRAQEEAFAQSRFTFGDHAAVDRLFR